MLCATIGNPAGKADFLHLSGVLICRSTSGVALTSFALIRTASGARFPNSPAGLQNRALQLLIGNDLSDDGGKRVHRVSKCS